MSEYPWNEKNNTFTWISSLYNPFKSFGNFTGKHLRWSPFLKNLQAEDLQLIKKTPTQVFSR